MINSILKIIVNGILILVSIKIMFLIVGGYIGFLFYHLNFAVYFCFQGILHVETMRIMVLVAIAGLFTFIFKKVKNIFSF